VIYLDPTAVMKLITQTPESPALTDYLLLTPPHQHDVVHLCP